MIVVPPPQSRRSRAPDARRYSEGDRRGACPAAPENCENLTQTERSPLQARSLDRAQAAQRHHRAGSGQSVAPLRAAARRPNISGADAIAPPDADRAALPDHGQLRPACRTRPWWASVFPPTSDRQLRQLAAMAGRERPPRAIVATMRDSDFEACAPDRAAGGHCRQLPDLSSAWPGPAAVAGVVKADAYGLGAELRGAGAGGGRLRHLLRGAAGGGHRACARCCATGAHLRAGWRAARCGAGPDRASPDAGAEFSWPRSRPGARRRQRRAAAWMPPCISIPA